MAYLDQLEHETIFILREAFARVKPTAMLWSIGKDSTALLWIIRKAFFGHVPFPMVQLDTEMELPEVYEFRDLIASEWKFDLRIELCPPESDMDPTLPPASRAAARKTAGLRNLIDRERFKGIILGIRRDEQSMRAKERIFSPRTADGAWDFRNQPAEFWDQYMTEIPEGQHLRIHPLLHWTEIDIWRYTSRENIPIVPLYLARSGYRYRSLGEKNITSPIKSNASSIEEIIAELEATNVPRAGRPSDGSRFRGQFRTPARLRIYVMNDSVSKEPGLQPHMTSAKAGNLRIVVVGHVDHGKSTMIGRLLHDTGSLPDGKMEELRQMSERRGMPLEWSFVLDSFQAERDQAITIDTTRIWLRTPGRDTVIIDAPGHREFLKNMISGASGADAAVLVVDAIEGVRDQTRRHAFLLKLLGFSQIAVVVNKIDLLKDSQSGFQNTSRAAKDYLGSLGLVADFVIPISAQRGDNLASRSDATPWYSGPTLIEVLGLFKPTQSRADRPLLIQIQDVYKFDDRRIVAGRVVSGIVRNGDQLLFSPGDRTAHVASIESFGAVHPVVSAGAGESVGLILDEPIFVERGQVASLTDSAPPLSDVFRAQLFWLANEPMKTGASYRIKLGTAIANVTVKAIESVVDLDTLDVRHADRVERNDLANVVLRASIQLPFAGDLHDVVLGRFVLLDGFDVVGGGLADLEGFADQRRTHLGRASNVKRVESLVMRSDREARSGHRGAVIWLTGLSGAGKSTLAQGADRILFSKGFNTFVLDGDNLRQGLNSDLGFTPEGREENIRRVGEVAALFASAGTVVISAFISPYEADRAKARAAAIGSFHEVYVEASLQTCERRDAKGLYKKARAGDIKDFTGVSAPYEVPTMADLTIDTDAADANSSINQLVDYIVKVSKI